MMEKHYFYNDGKQKYGPYTLDQLMNSQISEKTQIWTEGLDNWVSASEIPEVADILTKRPATPPPIEKQTQNQTDLINNTVANPEVLVVGIGFLGVNIAYGFFGGAKFVEADLNGVVLFALAVRVFTAFALRDYAIKLNRDTASWAIFGFITPTLGFLSMAFTGKKGTSESSSKQGKTNYFLAFLVIILIAIVLFYMYTSGLI